MFRSGRPPDCVKSLRSGHNTPCRMTGVTLHGFCPPTLGAPSFQERFFFESVGLRDGRWRGRVSTLAPTKSSWRRHFKCQFEVIALG